MPWKLDYNNFSIWFSETLKAHICLAFNFFVHLKTWPTICSMHFTPIVQRMFGTLTTFCLAEVGKYSNVLPFKTYVFYRETHRDIGIDVHKSVEKQRKGSITLQHLICYYYKTLPHSAAEKKIIKWNIQGLKKPLESFILTSHASSIKPCAKSISGS